MCMNADTEISHWAQQDACHSLIPRWYIRGRAKTYWARQRALLTGIKDNSAPDDNECTLKHGRLREIWSSAMIYLYVKNMNDYFQTVNFIHSAIWTSIGSRWYLETWETNKIISILNTPGNLSIQCESSVSYEIRRNRISQYSLAIIIKHGKHVSLVYSIASRIPLGTGWAVVLE